MSKNKEIVHLVTVGDSQTGKSSLLCALKDGKLTDQEIPEFYQTFSHKIKVDGKKTELGLWDTSGAEQYEGLRRLAYKTSDVFVVCYSVNSRKSFENVSQVWLPEVEKYGPPNAPVIIVATKLDLRPRSSLSRNESLGINSERPVPGERFVKYDEGLVLANDANAYAYLECSALGDNGVNEVFQEAVRAVLKRALEEKTKSKGRRGSGLRGMIKGK